ncbi:MAG: BRO family protein [bacterium]
MPKDKRLAIFEGKKIRRIWDEKQEKWYFSVIDIIAVLTDQANFQLARNYWKVFKNRLRNEGSETVTKCNRLKMEAEDGKLRETDAADVETLLRLIQSVPSPKAEPIKLWLARVGYERIEEINDPEKALNRSRDYWQKMGRSEKWIQQRMMGQEIRNKLTEYWKSNEVKERDEYAILTNIIHEEWSDLSVKEHKSLKNLKTENLRDHMTDAELVFTALAELSTRQIAETMETKGLEENKIPAKKGGRVAKNARLELEQKTGKKVVSRSNFKILPERKTIKIR